MQHVIGEYRTDLANTALISCRTRLTEQAFQNYSADFEIMRLTAVRGVFVNGISKNKRGMKR